MLDCCCGKQDTCCHATRTSTSKRTGLAKRSLLAWPLVLAVLQSLLQCCSTQTAYIVPSMQRDNPGNDSYVRLGTIFVNATLREQYDVVYLTVDYRVQPTLYPDDMVSLSRNLTIASANYSTQGYRLFELEFATQRILIPQGFSLTLKDLALGRARKTSGQGLPFFVGQGERSLLVLDNVIRIRTACAHNEPELVSALQGFPRRLPSTGGTGPRQKVEILPSFTFRGNEHSESIHALDVAYFVGPVDVPDTTYYAGYTMRQINSTRICETYVSDECVYKRGADVCVEEQTAALIGLNAPSPAPQRAAPGPNLAAIVAPSVLGASLLVAAAVGGMLVLARRWRRRQANRARDSLLPITVDKGGFGGSSGSGGDAAASRDQHSPGCSLPPAAVVDPTWLLMPFSGVSGSIEHLAIGNKGGSWQLGAFHTAPEFEDATPHDKLRLGVLLGAGSYARVYRGTWKHLDVAVKVLQHDSSTAEAVSNEVDLVMSFRHPNIVAAYYFVIWIRSRPQEDFMCEHSSPDAPAAAAAAGATPAGGSRLRQLSAASAGRALEPVAECTSSISTPHSNTRSLTVPGAAASHTSGSHGSHGSGRHHEQVCISLQDLSSGSAGKERTESGMCTGSASISGSIWAAGLTDPGSSGSLTQSRAGTSSGSGVFVQRSVQEGPRSLAGVGDLAASHSSGTSPHQAPAPAVSKQESSTAAPLQLVPVTCPSPQRQVPDQQLQVQQQVSTSSGLAYEVSSGHESSGFAAAAAACSSSTAASSLPGAACSSSRQPPTQLVLPELGSKEALGQPDMQQQQQQQGPQSPAASRPVATQSSSPAAQRSPLGSRSPAVASAPPPTSTSSRWRSSSGPPDEAETWLILELCDGGTLRDLLAPGGALGPEVVGKRRMGQMLTLLLDVASGMSYLHSRNVLHGDLKPCNVLIKHEQGAPYGRVAKVGDFGLSRALQVGQSHKSTRTFGTLNHTSPELLRLGRLSPAGDVYAFGVIMWEVFTGQVAFSGMHYGEVFETVALQQRRPEVPQDVPHDYAELMQQCWAADPIARPLFAAVQQRLEVMLASLLQDEAEAQERFVFDL